MKRVSRFILVMVCLVSSFLYGADAIFDDGGTHNISTWNQDGVLVYDSPDNLPSTVNLLTGGYIQHGMDAYGLSKINIIGGSVNYAVNGHQNSTIEMTTGYIGGWFDAYDSSTIILTGGQVVNWARAYNDSSVEIHGGKVNGLYATDASHCLVSGGIFDNEIWADAYGYIHVFGGDIRKGVWVEGNGTVLLTGGSFRKYLDGSKHLKVDQSGTLFISGTNFNYSYGEILDRSGTLTGTLANGDLLDDFFTIADNGRIFLVPEPCTLLLLGLGGLLIRSRK